VNFFLKAASLALVASQFTQVAATQSKPDDTNADAVAAAFVDARQVAHLSKLTRMDRNPFGEKICKHDMRMPSGLISDVLYETSDPAHLSDAARKLATSPDSYRIIARFGVGVCSLGSDSSGRVRYSVFIAIYESRWASFWRVFWE
jgi:hypothetical protein